MTPTDEQLAARAQLTAARTEHRSLSVIPAARLLLARLFLPHAGHAAQFRRELGRLFQLHVTRPHDRALFPDLLADG